MNGFKELFLHFEAFLFLAEETFNSVEIEEQNDPIWKLDEIGSNYKFSELLVWRLQVDTLRAPKSTFKVCMVAQSFVPHFMNANPTNQCFSLTTLIFGILNVSATVESSYTQGDGNLYG